MSKVQEVLEIVKGMTVLELSDLIKSFEEEFGVSAAAPMAMMAAPVGGAAEEAAVEEQSEFDVVLTAAGDKKIQVVKVVREITGLGLKESKELVDEAPKPVKEKISKEEAEAIRDKLVEAGASIEIK